jgi:hypothetical protein
MAVWAANPAVHRTPLRRGHIGLFRAAFGGVCGFEIRDLRKDAGKLFSDSKF